MNNNENTKTQKTNLVSDIQVWHEDFPYCHAVVKDCVTLVDKRLDNVDASLLDDDKVCWITRTDSDPHTDLYHDFLKVAKRTDLSDDEILFVAYKCHDLAKQKRDRATSLKDAAFKQLTFWKRRRQLKNSTEVEKQLYGYLSDSEIENRISHFYVELKATETFLRQCMADLFWIEYFTIHKDG